MFRFLFTVIFLLSVYSDTFSQNIDSVKLNRYFDALEQSDKFMGRVALAHKGRLIFERNLGYSDLDAGIKPEKYTAYRVGSISKTFTATMILMASEEGKILLTDKLSTWFPSIPNADSISVENLLRHSSGVYSFTDDSDYLSWNTQPKTEEDLVAKMASHGPVFEPGSREEYSNSNYVLLSYILEKIYHEPFHLILEKKITTPLGLHNTFIEPGLESDNSFAKSYTFRGQWKEETVTHFSIPMGAGNIASTPEDMSAFAYGLFSGKLISEESLAKMTTISENFGLGVFKLPFYGRTSFGHTGGIDGFTSIFGHFPEDDITCVILSNGASLNNNEVAIIMLKAAFQMPYDIPEFTRYVVSPEKMETYSGVYTSKDLPLQITITVDEGVLMAQATGQPSFALEAVEENIFQFTLAGVVIEFKPEANTMILKQGGGEFLFSKSP
jgi:CubicO group peptidase (beta-lactamase class C family)